MTSITTQDEQKGRGGISVTGATDAVAFLSSRWRTIEAASKNSNLSEKERPQILREKVVGPTATSAPTGNTKQQSSGTSTPTSKGSPWSGGRRH